MSACAVPGCHRKPNERSGECQFHTTQRLYGPCVVENCSQMGCAPHGYCIAHRARADLKTFLRAACHKMRSRCRTKRGKSAVYYRHLPFASAQTFLDAFLTDKCLQRLWKSWVASGHEQRLRPVPDRVNSSEGYFPWNVEWVTFSENSRRACESRAAG